MKKAIVFCLMLPQISICLPTNTTAQEGQRPERLTSDPACKADVEAALRLELCSPWAQVFNQDDDLALLSCLSNLPVSPPPGFEPGIPKHHVSVGCQHVLWEKARALTAPDSDVVVQTLKQFCSEDWPSLEESCLPSPSQHQSSLSRSHILLTCLIDSAHNIDRDHGLVEACRSRILLLESVIFTDFHLIGDFLESCSVDVRERGCGRVSGRDPSHSQGVVIDCLMRNVSSLSSSCQAEIFLLAEYQSEDFHLDRALFLACKDDRLRICPKVKSGEGRVYKCLMMNKQSPEMSEECENQLTRRQALIAGDYKVSLNLRVACKKEIAKHECKKTVDARDHKHVKLAEILLCLEEVAREGRRDTISGECIFEMKEHRRMLMEDFRISPEIVSDCKEDIKTKCGKLESGGKTLHCLMSAASEGGLSSSCQNILTTLLREVDVASDWTLDPLLQQNCQEVVSRGCDPKGFGTTGESVMNCLMDLSARNSRFMTRACKTSLTEIQYFLARDFQLNPRLYKKCKADAEKFCDARDYWHKDTEGRGALVFPCLVRYLYVDESEDPNGIIGELSDDCADEVEKVLEQRAVSVNLHPEVEGVCREDLIVKCAGATGDGEEIACLQDHFESLGSDCQQAVATYTRVESRDVNLNTAVALACRGVIAKYCKEEEAILGERNEGGGVMHCLLDLKTSHSEDLERLDPKCSTVLEHWQILTLKDWTFSPAFKAACQKDIKHLCSEPVRPRSKLEVLSCLSETVQSDLIEEVEHRVSRACRQELRFELLQKHDDIHLNPKLAKDCNQELERFCKHDQSLECLKSLNRGDLGKICRKSVFAEQREEVMQNKVDSNLMLKCENEISRHCSAEHEEPNGILNCLKENMEDVNFDLKCKRVVVRRIIQQMRDFRLNPRLYKACTHDLPKFCSSEFSVDEKDFFEGKVIQCLKDTFVKEEDNLSRQCRDEVENLLRQAALDIRANLEVSANCPKSVHSCRKKLHINDTTSDGGRIEECLKDLFRKKELGQAGDGPSCIVSVAKIIEVESVDIQVDRGLHEACQLDLAKFCREVSPGGGRQIACLRDVLDDQNLGLERRCEDVLKRRLETYLMALEAFHIRSVHDLYVQVSRSPYGNVIFGLFGATFLLCLVLGVLLGRVTKRAKEAKNK